MTSESGAGSRRKRTSVDSASPVTALSGVGPERAEALLAAGISTVADLAALWPRRHDRLPALSTVAELADKKLVALRGTVHSRKRVRSRRGTGGHLTAVLDDGTGKVTLRFFNQGYLFESTPVGETLYIVGACRDDETGRWIAPHFHRRGENAAIDGEETFIPIYPPVGDIKPGVLAKLIAAAAAIVAEESRDPLPPETLARRGLPPLAETILGLHRPAGREDIEEAERRLLYDGFFSAALDVEIAKAGRDDIVHAVSFRVRRAAENLPRLLQSLPFALTGAQSSAVATIIGDLSGETPMRRLLQGDVGSGKTVVAVLAAGLAALEGAQVAVLAPTEILARQLRDVLSRFLAPVGVAAELLIGAVQGAERREVLARIASGEAKVVVGTQALLGPSVAFRSLALVVIDEQHRFGVRQRRALVQKGDAPHLLVMSATPIPRTLALTLYGDLDLLEMRERPAGRAPIVTEVVKETAERPFDWAALSARVRAGAKAFVVYPAIESEDPRVPSLFREGRAVAKKYFRDVAVKGAHGRLAEEEKAAAVAAFRDGTARMLFATTVIEVGIDVPDAAEIVVLGAQRFGLAQVHQMRGRVGRGGLPGRCTLVADDAATAADVDRLKKIAASDDGFAIAELDLEVRGPGDMMGLRQHGLGFLLPTRADRELLEAAFADARAFVADGREVADTADVLRRWSRRTSGQIGQHRDSG